MTSVLEGARKLLSRGSDLSARIDGLERATRAARGRLDDETVTEAEAVAERAAGRLRLSADHTVVAIAGATGSGKSSTFNALTGLELAAVGVRRPTTSWATACVWGADGADDLLDWLGIPPRHRTSRDSMLDSRRDGAGDERAMEGVVLLDLPDHDSTEVSHHLEVQRIVGLADLLVWVLDPQKYADAAIHDRFLAPLATHAGVMLVILNHIDTVPAPRRETMVADVRRLLDADGLVDVPLLATSARDGDGVPALRAAIASRVAAKKTSRKRLEADLRAAASRLAEESGTAAPRSFSAERVRSLEDALADSAGVPTVVEAIERSSRIRAGQATGWPVVSWLSRLRPDPLRRLHLDLGSEGRRLASRSRTSMPEATPVQRARVDTEVRALADDVAGGLTPAWAAAIRRASLSHVGDVSDRLDVAIAETDLGVARVPAWAGAVRLLQWLLVVVTVAGAAWSIALGLSGSLALSSVPSYAGIDLPLLMLVGGVVAGVLLGLACRGLVRLTARRRAQAADRRLRAAVHVVAEELVVAPVEAELAAYDAVRSGLAAVTGR